MRGLLFASAWLLTASFTPVPLAHLRRSASSRHVAVHSCAVDGEPPASLDEYQSLIGDEAKVEDLKKWIFLVESISGVMTLLEDPMADDERPPDAAELDESQWQSAYARFKDELCRRWDPMVQSLREAQMALDAEHGFSSDVDAWIEEVPGFADAFEAHVQLERRRAAMEVVWDRVELREYFAEISRTLCDHSA
jgi:hypothetical protein